MAIQTKFDTDFNPSQAELLLTQLYPLCRSITGQGVRDSLALLQQHIPLEIKAIASGTKVLDWTVPDEWHIRDAYIKDDSGNRVVDFKQHNLHVMSYSQPVNAFMSLDELQLHLHSLAQQPDWIPYKTSYYQPNWGFCLTHHQREQLKAGQYQVCIDASFKQGELNWGELLIKGKSDDEVLISTHICHPSMANDNLSGMLVALFLAKSLLQQTQALRYSYRFVFVPGTIGAISWLAVNQAKLHNIKHGLVLSGLGDAAELHYKVSRQGNAEIDRLMGYLLSSQPHQILPFSPYGYDERQYCSPGFNLPVGRLSRAPYATYPEYHTSADNLDFIEVSQLQKAHLLLLQLVEQLENARYFHSKQPNGEPCLSKYGLYDDANGQPVAQDVRMALLWVLNLSDGQHSLVDIIQQSGLSKQAVEQAVQSLLKAGLIDEKQ